jgi:hypothetical protein
MLGYDRSVIAKAETGERPPSEDVMKAMVKALGLDQVVTRLASLARQSTGIPAWFLSLDPQRRQAAGPSPPGRRLYVSISSARQARPVRMHQVLVLNELY